MVATLLLLRLLLNFAYYTLCLLRPVLTLFFRHHGCRIQANDLCAVAAVLLSTDHGQRRKIHKEGKERQASCLSIVSKHTIFFKCTLSQYVAITVYIKFTIFTFLLDRQATLLLFCEHITYSMHNDDNITNTEQGSLHSLFEQ